MDKTGEYDGAELVREFKQAYPDAYARWFLLEALHQGINYVEVGQPLNEFLWGRYGKRSEPLIEGGMAMRGVVYAEARAFLDRIISELREDQWRDLTRLIGGYAAARSKG